MKNILCTICAKVDAKVFLKNTGLDYKKPMDVYQESIKLNQNKKKAS